MKLISKVTEIYCIADDFCEEYELELNKKALRRVNQQVQNYNISFVELILGVSKLSFCLGLELIFFCIIAIFLSV